MTTPPQDDLEIMDLLDYPDAQPIVARWIHDEWAWLSGRTYEHTLARYSQNIERDVLPVSLVGRIGDAPVGLASLRERDSVDWYPGVTPWICNVYVAQEARHKGIAGRLCRVLEDVALRLGYETVYLATEYSDSLYHRLGYQDIHQGRHEGHPIYVVRKNLYVPT